MRRIWGLTAAATALLSIEAIAIKDKDNQGRWEKRVESGPDREVPGFLVNLGPTGARAVLTEKTFVVRYVFKSSPADGRLRLNDVVTGVAGRPFSSHTFGGEPHGYEGPILDLGEAIERAEGKDGRLVLNILRGSETLEVAVPLEAIGTFSATFPAQCRKSELLRSRALKYLADHPEAAGGPAHARSMAILAMLTSGDSAQESIGKRWALAWNDIPGPGTWSWGVSYQLITLAEYHLLTGDPAVLPTIKALANLLREDQYDGRIVVWAAKPNEDPAAIDAAQQLYLGGFGHAPYVSGVGKNGYGPMQYTTILAVIAWQLAERCGVKADPKGLRNALEFIHRGTNEAGYLAYGGEFTLNNGLIDSAAWKKSTSGTNYVGRAGASLIAHSLSPEFPDSAKYAEKNKGYLKKAYKSLPDGHACSVLGFAWGLLGAAASEDDAVVRTMFDYHKAWFNMMRCHDGSFVVQPGRDYADGGYYISSRYNPTAVMALVLGLGYPKLLIQGTQVSIPGVNPKALKGGALAAYRTIVAKAYGDAGRMLKSAGPDAAPMGAYLDAQAKRAIEPLKALETAGRWALLRDRVAELRRAYAGLAPYDEAAAAWEAMTRGKEGTAIVAADRHFVEGSFGPALASLDGLDSPAARALRDLTTQAADRTLASLDTLHREARWNLLKDELARLRSKLAGIRAFDERVHTWDLEFATPEGRAWIASDKLYSQGDLGGAARALAGHPSPEASRRIEAAAKEQTAPLAELEAKGDWYAIEKALGPLHKKLAGIPSFDDRESALQAALKNDPARTALRQGAVLARIREAASRKPAPPGLVKEIEAFIQQSGETLYGREAKDLLKSLSR